MLLELPRYAPREKEHKRDARNGVVGVLRHRMKAATGIERARLESRIAVLLSERV